MSESLEMVFEYFVAFSRIATAEDGTEKTIFENKLLTMTRELTAIEQIFEIEQLITKQYNYSQVSVINFILLKKTVAENSQAATEKAAEE